MTLLCRLGNSLRLIALNLNTQPFSYVPQNAYVLQNGASGLGFYKVNAANTIKITSFRAYLTDPLSAPEFLPFEGNTTGIESVKSVGSKGEFFNLAGQRVAQPAKGLYIVNGKKVIF